MSRITTRSASQTTAKMSGPSFSLAFLESKLRARWKRFQKNTTSEIIALVEDYSLVVDHGGDVSCIPKNMRRRLEQVRSGRLLPEFLALLDSDIAVTDTLSRIPAKKQKKILATPRVETVIKSKTGKGFDVVNVNPMDDADTFKLVVNPKTGDFRSTKEQEAILSGEESKKEESRDDRATKRKPASDKIQPALFESRPVTPSKPVAPPINNDSDDRHAVTGIYTSDEKRFITIKASAMKMNVAQYMRHKDYQLGFFDGMKELLANVDAKEAKRKP